MQQAATHRTAKSLSLMDQNDDKQRIRQKHFFSVVALLSRVLMSAIFIWAGFGKLMAAAAPRLISPKSDFPMPSLVYLLAVAVELGGGTLMLVGLFTRPAAIVLGLWCVGTAIVGHSDFGDRNMEIHFMKNLTMAGGFAYVMLLGAGAFSIDGLLGKRRTWRRLDFEGKVDLLGHADPLRKCCVPRTIVDNQDFNVVKIE